MFLLSISKWLRTKGLLCLLGLVVCLTGACVPAILSAIYFASPQDALSASKIVKSTVAVSLDGEDSTLVIYFVSIEENARAWYFEDILPRTEKGWKMALSHRSLSTYFSEKCGKKCSVTIMGHEEIQGYYVLYRNIAPESDLEITDNRESAFHVFIEPDDSLDPGRVWCYTYIEAFDENYELVINGEIIRFDDWIVSTPPPWLELLGN